MFLLFCSETEQINQLNQLGAAPVILLLGFFALIGFIFYLITKD
jgi:hypothetical protein